MKTTFYVKVDATRSNLNGSVTAVKASSVTQATPRAVGGDSLVLKMTMDIPESAFEAQEILITFKDNPAKAIAVVTDLQKWVAELDKPS